MTELSEPIQRPRYRWPWFVLGGVILGIVLAVIWMSAAVRRTREIRDPSYPHPQNAPISPVPAATNASSIPGHLVAFRDVLSGGDAAAGRKIFFENPTASCAKCHKVDGQGGENGPPLDDIAERQTRAFILESILFPNIVIPTNYETAIVLLKNNTGASGTIRSEDEEQLVLNTPEEGVVTIQKSDIQFRQRGASPMPEGIIELLSRDQLRDLVEFVARGH